MKLRKPISWLGLVIVLTVVLLLIPTAAVFAGSLTVPATPVSVGGQTTATGSGFNPGSQVYIYISTQQASIGNHIDQQVTLYATAGSATADTNTNISATITIPPTIGTVAVGAGTYYLYAVVTGAGFDATLIQAVTTIQVLANASLSAANPASGAPGTTVTLTGTNFLPSHALTITFDGVAVTPLTGATTSAAGAVAATLMVPDATGGVHTISVSDGTTTKTTSFTVTAEILLTPQSGKAGDPVLIDGFGFGRLVIPDIYINLQAVTPVTPVRTATDGSFSATFNVPDLGLAAGNYQILVDDGTNSATAPFQLTVPVQPTPTETATPTPTETATPTPTETATTTTPVTPTPVIQVLSAGTNVVISGSDFAPDGQIVISMDGEMIGTLTANEAGDFVSQFQVASDLSHGDHIISVTDGSHTEQYTYTVESTPPDIPIPSGPLNGATPKSPITFEWSSVTDPSSPVTYELQIASDAEFSANAILVNKTELALPMYTLTTDEQADLAGRSEPYFWHIRAVDAAENASPWTGAAEIHVPAPFSFPTWLIYTLGGVGAVIIFGIGYLVGRRTAFYY
jgi:hypothetical protein